MAKKKTARERGYAPKAEVVAELRKIVDDFESGGYPWRAKHNQLAKLNLGLWVADDDELPSEPKAATGGGQ